MDRSPPTSRLLLVRHGESTWNAEGRWAGQADPDLTSLGEAQALELADRVRSAGIDRIVSSDLRRARTTAEIVGAALRTDELSTDARLRERHSTDWCGLTHQEIEADWPGHLDAWRSRTRLDLPGETESWPTFVSRVEASIREILHERLVTLVVTHAGVFRAVEVLCGATNRQVNNAGGQWIEAHAGDLSLGPAI